MFLVFYRLVFNLLIILIIICVFRCFFSSPLTTLVLNLQLVLIYCLTKIISVVSSYPVMIQRLDNLHEEQ